MSIASSDGVDEPDDEPFSANASSIVAAAPKQDVLPRRPNAGGRFPSDIMVNTQRGLQAPLSASSGSSGNADTQDRDAIAEATNLPGSGVGQHYGEDPTSTPFSPTHAALVNRHAEEDGVNPYTSQPISPEPDVSQAPEQPGLEAVIIGIPGTTDSDSAPPLMAGARSMGGKSDPALVSETSTEQVPNNSTIQTTPGSESSDVLTRPTLAAGQSVSQLHVPGEFPRHSKVSTDSLSSDGSKMPA